MHHDSRMYIVCAVALVINTLEIVAQCSSDEFKCGNYTCISLSKRCDNSFDCVDASDETNCTSESNTCREGLMKCPDGSCISSSNTNCSEVITTTEETSSVVITTTEETQSDTITTTEETQSTNTGATLFTNLTEITSTSLRSTKSNLSNLTTASTPREGIIPRDDNTDRDTTIAVIFVMLFLIGIIITLTTMACYVRHKRNKMDRFVVEYKKEKL